MTNSLAKLKAKHERAARLQEDFDRPKPKWFKIQKNERLNVRFLQELSEDSPKFDGALGTSPADPEYNIGLYYNVFEHQAHGPKGFMSRALDTMETEGRDFAQEMYEKNPQEDGWRRRDNFYITVAVDRGESEPSVEILSRGANNDFVKELVEMYDDPADPDNPGITGRTFQIRKGSKLNSPWTIVEQPHVEIDTTGLVPYDLARDAVRRVSYEDQREFYMKNYEPDAPDEAQTRTSVSDFSGPAKGGDDDPDW